MNTFQPIYSIQNLSYAYPDSRKSVINNINLRIPEKSISVILGINGSGKSTLLRLLLGTLVPDKGEIHYYRKEEKGKVAFVPQNEYLVFDYSVMEYVLFGRIPYINIYSSPAKEDQKYALSVIEDLGIQDLAIKKITHLSGGELQKVRLARALVQKPSLLILDEPTTYLDIRSKKIILEILNKLKDKGVPVIFATHDPSEASEIADYFILMRKEKQPYSGCREEVFTDSKLSEIYSLNLHILNIKHKQYIVSE
jgi:iron complex transport system ATP-binding protein